MLQTLETLQPCKNTRRNGGVSTNWNSGEWVISNDASTAAWNDSRRVLARASGFVTSVSPLDRSAKHNFTSLFPGATNGNRFSFKRIEKLYSCRFFRCVFSGS